MSNRILKPIHKRPQEPYLDYILLPYGYKYNTEFLNVTKGQEMAFYGGSSAKVYTSTTIPLNSPLADILCRMRYGMPIAKIVPIWKRNAIALGHGKGAVNDDECIMVVFYGEENIEY